RLGLLARHDDGRLVADQRRGPDREHDRYLGDVRADLLGVAAVVQPDREDLPGDDWMEDPDVARLVLAPVGAFDCRPALRGGDEAARTGGAGVGDRRVVEPPDPGVAVWVLEPDSFHARVV